MYHRKECCFPVPSHRICDSARMMPPMNRSGRRQRLRRQRSLLRRKKKDMTVPIAQGGSNVSGGQKQRLAIARAIAKHPQIFMFDDSFSALDLKTDAALRRALGKNVNDKHCDHCRTADQHDPACRSDSGTGRWTALSEREHMRNCCTACEVYRADRENLSCLPKNLELEESEVTDDMSNGQRDVNSNERRGGPMGRRGMTAGRKAKGFQESPSENWHVYLGKI